MAARAPAPSDPAVPTAVTVIKPSGDVVAELLVSNRMPIAKLKTQIEGLEGTAAGNQTLLLEGRPLDNDRTLADFGIGERATLLLVCCAPLLSGQLTQSDLQSLVSDDAALEQAIDAYTDDPQYSSAEVQTILADVLRALCPEGAGRAGEILGQLPPDLLRPRGGRAAQRA
eukprot:CAMPEP_0179262114 /NCGR_PEP_ID=MMETSP0797-20121207/27205_1 /TAXON_ID=47934 /ORGANISM="Dinophysis acuminata, Strain DAEP01" /LENGTH=170 /DNA_ID=CAMNT_0020970249 /DNA_START=45 /DNA_END=553 /DNA_ORIENTATION=-